MQALWLLYIYRSLSASYPQAEVEKHLRSAIREFGHYKGRIDGPDFSSRKEMFSWPGRGRTPRAASTLPGIPGGGAKDDSSRY